MDGTVMTEVYAGFYELIGGRQYDLEDVLHRIDVMYAAGRLTDDERTALYALARENAKAEYDCSAEIESLWAAVRDIRERLTALEGESRRNPRSLRRMAGVYSSPRGRMTPITPATRSHTMGSTMSASCLKMWLVHILRTSTRRDGRKLLTDI